MKNIIAIVIVLVVLIGGWNVTAYRDVSSIKEQAPEYISSLGFNVLASDGYSGDPIYGGTVFYQATREENPGLLYSIQVVEWRGELQSYDPEVINTNLIVNN